MYTFVYIFLFYVHIYIYTIFKLMEFPVYSLNYIKYTYKYFHLQTTL